MKYRKNSIQNTKRCIICNKPYTYNYDLFGRNCLVHIYNQLNIKIPKFIPNKEWYLCKIISYKNFKFFLSKNKRYALAKNYIILDYLNKINLKSLEDYRKKVIQNIKNINIFRKNPISLLTPYTVNDYISSTDTVPMSLFSSTLNNFAAISSSYGVIKPFNFMIKMKVKNYKIEKK